MYNDSFQAGDKVSPRHKNIQFIDGTIHKRGVEYTVQEFEIPYYNIYGKDYRLTYDIHTDSR